MSYNLHVKDVSFEELPGDPNGEYVMRLSWNGFPYWSLDKEAGEQDFYIIGEYGTKRFSTTLDPVLINASLMVAAKQYQIKTVGNTNFVYLGASSNAPNVIFTYNGVSIPFDSTGTVDTVSETSVTEGEEMIWSLGYDTTVDGLTLKNFIAHTSSDYPSDDSVWYLDVPALQNIIVKTNNLHTFKTLNVSGLSTRNDDVTFVEDPNGTYFRGRGLLDGHPFWEKCIRGLNKNEIIYAIRGVWELSVDDTSQSSGALRWTLTRSEKTTLERSPSPPTLREKANVLINFTSTLIAQKNGAFPWDIVPWKTPSFSVMSMTVAHSETPPLFSRRFVAIFCVLLFVMLFGALFYSSPISK